MPKFAAVSCSAVLLVSGLVCVSQPLRAEETNAPAAADEKALRPEDVQFFEQSIRPLLEQRCYKCHSAQGDVVESGLQLDSRPGWEVGGDSGPAIVPGKPEESLLIRALSYSDDEPIQMPPEGKLAQREIDLLTEWVRRGAPDPRNEAVSHAKKREINLSEEGKHWAYQPLAVVAPPTVKNEDWCRTPIDRFILAKLEEKGITPNGPAERRKLIRRLYFDVIGLPPTPAEVEAFVNDTSDNAYEKLVDHVLASPHFGERWGRHWLDIARYAESHGFEQDYDRPTAYPYRDFVIKAINEDLPYNDFVKWQLAGDEIAPENPMAMQATGFLAAGVHATQITANQAEKERYDELDDMTRTTGTTMLGLTIGCARCHDHKFDPVPMNDYYKIAATFTTTVRSEYDAPVNTERYQLDLAKHKADAEPLRAALEKFEREELAARFDAWRALQPEEVQPSWVMLDPAEYRSAGGATLTRQEDLSLLATGTNPDFDVYTLVFNSNLKNLTALRIEALADPSMVKGGPGRAANGNFDLTHLRVTARPLDGSAAPVELKLVNPKATFEQGPHLAVALAIDDKKQSGWAVDPQFGKDHAAVFEFAQNVGYEGGVSLELTLEFNGNNKHNFGRTRVSVTTAPRPVGLELGGAPPEVIEALKTLGKTSVTTLSASQRASVLNWYKTTDARWSELNDALNAHLKNAPMPETLKMLISSEGVPAVRLHTQGPDFYEKTYVVKRGDPNQKVEEAKAGFLTVLSRHPDGDAHWVTPPPQGSHTSFRRYSLANWITDVDHGAGHLLARVIVNRLWQHHMGRGIVATPSDFGTQGTPPTHPELLDWMADQLLKHNWRLKPMHKLILTSSVYMQSAEADEARIAADRENQLWWRRPGSRLQGEIVRDALLATSGQLDTTMYGPGTLDERMKRRSIYFFIKRSQLIPMMTLFDGPDTLQDLALRANTTVAPQALLMMNSPIVRGYAEGFAGRISAQSNDLAAQVQAAYEIALSRQPTAEEQQVALEFIGTQTSTYEASGVANAAQVALADYCQTILSLNEFIYVD